MTALALLGGHRAKREREQARAREERERESERGARERVRGARESNIERLITCVTALALLGGTELDTAELTYWRQYLYFCTCKALVKH